MVRAIVRILVMASLVLATGGALPAWAGDAEDCGNAATLLQTAPARVLGACRRLADQGNAPAQALLGFMYAGGLGVTQSEAEAAKWWRKAADQGLAAAQFLLGNAYFMGQGLPLDYVQAHMWLSLAAAHGSAERVYADAVKIRDLAAAKMTPAQIEQAKALAAAWKPTAGQ